MVHIYCSINNDSHDDCDNDKDNDVSDSDNDKDYGNDDDKPLTPHKDELH